jgi:hypothetical protein
MIKIPTMFVRDESKPGHPVTDQIKPECQWVLDGEGQATRKLDGMNVKIENATLYKRQKPKERDYDNASYVQCDIGSPNDKYLFEAMSHTKNLSDGIYEAIGPKIQGNPEHTAEHKLVRVVPCDEVLFISEAPRTYQELLTYFSLYDLEGIVFHHSDGRMAKIKKKDFGLKREPKP